MEKKTIRKKGTIVNFMGCIVDLWVFLPIIIQALRAFRRARLEAPEGIKQQYIFNQTRLFAKMLRFQSN